MGSTSPFSNINLLGVTRPTSYKLNKQMIDCHIAFLLLDKNDQVTYNVAKFGYRVYLKNGKGGVS